MKDMDTNIMEEQNKPKFKYIKYIKYNYIIYYI